MLRLVLFELFVFTTPFLAYGLYVVMFNKRQEGESVFKDAPLFNLCLIGLLLVGSGILAYGLYWS